MADRRISHVKGKGVLNHNNRNYVYKNVDPGRTKNNIIYAMENIDEAYHKCFGQSLADYNAKQKRADRKIDDYYTHLFGNAPKYKVATSTNKEKSFYEVLAQVGDMKTCAVGSADGETAAKILDEYARGFSVRNPQFYVFNSVLHLDEKTPHLHIDYIPVADGYKNGMQTRNSLSVALQQMGFGKHKDSINQWRIQERQVINELCQKYGLEIAEETKGRGKSFTPDEYKKIRDDAKAELKSDPDVLDEIKDEIRADVESELFSEQQYLLDEIDKNNQRINEQQDKKAKLQNDIEKEEKILLAEKEKVKTEQKTFTDMQQKFKPRKDDLDKVKRIKSEAKTNFTGGKVTLLKADYDFLISLANQHARISDTTLAALEKHSQDTEKLKHCQNLYLAVASEVAALSYSDRSKLTYAVQDVLRDVTDTRVVSWAIDDMVNHKPSDLAEILEAREVKINKKYEYAKKIREYNQPDPVSLKVKKKSQSHERG